MSHDEIELARRNLSPSDFASLMAETPTERNARVEGAHRKNAQACRRDVVEKSSPALLWTVERRG